MTAPAPGQAPLSPAFARWYRIGLPLAADAVLAAAWANQHEAERAFWAEVDAAQEPHAPEAPKVLGHPDDAAEEWLAETYEPDDSATGVGYERSDMIDAYHAGWDEARERIAKFGKDTDGRWIALEPLTDKPAADVKPAPELATEADAQAWLERQANHLMETGEFASDVMPGVSRLACEIVLDGEDLRDMRRSERFEPKPFTIWCYWYGVRLTTTRDGRRT